MMDCLLRNRLRNQDKFQSHKMTILLSLHAADAWLQIPGIKFNNNINIKYLILTVFLFIS